MQTHKKIAFTLVELIVVITILAILGTIAFIGFQEYSSHSRDTKQMASVETIIKSASAIETRTGRFPSDQSLIPVINSGTILAYQWGISKTLAGLLQWGNDMSQNTAIRYITNANKTKATAWVLLENAQNATTILGIDPLIAYFAKGDDIPVVMNSGAIVQDTGTGILLNTSSFSIVMGKDTVITNPQTDTHIAEYYAKGYTKTIEDAALASYAAGKYNPVLNYGYGYGYGYGYWYGETAGYGYGYWYRFSPYIYGWNGYWYMKTSIEWWVGDGMVYWLE